jgi:hypothetical protein
MIMLHEHLVLCLSFAQESVWNDCREDERGVPDTNKESHISVEPFALKLFDDKR